MPKKKIEQHSVPIEETIAKGDETALKKTEIDEVSSQEVKEEVLKEEAEVLEVKEVPKEKVKKEKKAKKQSDSPSAFVRFFKKITVKQWISFAIIVVVYVLLAIFTSQNMYELIRLTLFSAVPLALVAMGGLYSERSGVVNIALEGIMMFGAFVGILTLERIQSTGVDGQWVIFIALLIGGIAGVIFSLLHAFAAITMKSDQTISGTALNMLSLALAIFLGRALSHGGTEEIKFANTYRIDRIPGLDKIPFFGQVLFSRVYLITLFGLLLFWLMAVLAYKTKFGLRLRACGENPQAADAAGINVIKTRYIAVLISGFLAGTAGVLLIVPTTISFRASVYGFGFLGLAVLISGQWRPKRVLIFALLFGFLRSLASGIDFVIQDLANLPSVSQFLKDIPKDIIKMLPYVFTLIVLAITSKKSRAPKAVGEPFDQGKR